MYDDKISIFNTVGNAFSAIDIAEPIRIKVPPTKKLIDVWYQLMETQYGDQFCLIQDQGYIYGYLTLDDEVFVSESNERSTDKPIKDFAIPITPNLIVPSNIPLLDLVQLFQKQYFFFILQSNSINHIVTFQDLDKLPVKLCLFSLFMKLEDEILKLLEHSDSIEKYLNLLPQKRYNNALELCRMKYGDKENSYLILRCTNFIDKKTIIRKSLNILKRLPFSSKTELDSFFCLVEKVRNSIAHSDSIMEILTSPFEFNSFVNKLQRLIEAVFFIKCESLRKPNNSIMSSVSKE